MKENSAVIQVQLPVEAATFLLNEKRSEIHAIEERMGVKVVLIPNIHLETPNYKIVRLRHDDVSDDNARASYEMVELPSEIEEASATQQKPEIAKQVAAVKGITPAAPAPVRAEPVAKAATKTTLFSRFRTWLGGISSAKPEEEKPAPQQRKREAGRRNERGERNERGNRGERGERNERNERGGRGERGGERNRNEAREEQPRNEKPRNERPPRQQQQEAKQAAAKPEKVERERQPATAVEGAEGAEQPQRSRRGRRGGRDRGPRNEARNAAATETTNVENAAVSEQVKPAAAPVVEPAVVVEAPVAAPVIETPAPVAAIEQPAAEIVTEVVAEAVVAETTAAAEPVAEVAAPVETEAAAEEPAAKAERKPRQPRRRKPEADKADAEQMPLPNIAESGLEMVETRADAVKAAVVEEVAPPAPRKPAAWQKKATDDAGDEPLVMVETGK